jgi:hypothetical protein
MAQTLAGLYGAKKGFDALTGAASFGPSTPVATALNGGTLTAGGTIIPPAEPTTITNFAGSATPYLGAAGVAAGGYNAYRGIKSGNEAQAGLGGATAALGLNAMGYALGPWGWGAMVAAPVVASLFKRKSTKEKEADRWKAVGKENPGPMDYLAGTPGEKTRDQRFITADRLARTADVYNNAKDFDSWSSQQKSDFLNGILNEQKFNERKGGIYFDDEFATDLAGKVRAAGQRGLGIKAYIPPTVEPTTTVVSKKPLMLTEPTMSKAEMARARRQSFMRD